MSDSGGLRSPRWFGARDLAGFVHRASLAAATADGFRGLAEAVRRGAGTQGEFRSSSRRSR